MAHTMQIEHVGRPAQAAPRVCGCETEVSKIMMDKNWTREGEEIRSRVTLSLCSSPPLATTMTTTS